MKIVKPKKGDKPVTTHCPQCGKKVPKGRTRFCSFKCSTKYFNTQNLQQSIDYNRQKRGMFEPGREKCQICGNYYKSLAVHYAAAHKIKKHAITTKPR